MMRVFDFDNTIYRGESSVDFFLYYLKKFPFQVAKYIPVFVSGIIRYKTGRLTVDEVLKSYSSIFRECCAKFENIPEEIKTFCDKNEKNIKPFYLEIKDADDVILSASPEVVLREMCARIGVYNIIGSELDIESGEVKSVCFRGNKIGRFREVYADARIDEFYTDSYVDKPFMDISDNVYLVRGNKIKKIKENGIYLIKGE
ncbi:MAG: HAD family hydrolase [Ruminococcaceae bacterium]|nr:HAD family hydrolase [Oscillospiraceae bacterium]